MKTILFAAALILSISALAQSAPIRLHRDAAVINHSAGTNIIEHKFTPTVNSACTVTATFTGRIHSAAVGPQRVGLEIGQTKQGNELQVSQPMSTTDANFTVQASRNVVAGVPAQVLLTTFSHVNVNHTLSGIDVVIDCQPQS